MTSVLESKMPLEAMSYNQDNCLVTLFWYGEWARIQEKIKRQGVFIHNTNKVSKNILTIHSCTKIFQWSTPEKVPIENNTFPG